MATAPPTPRAASAFWYYTFRFICGLIFFFLIAPIIIMVPLSFNSQPYFTFSREMLTFDPGGLFPALVRGSVHLGRAGCARSRTPSSSASPPPFWRRRSAPWPRWGSAVRTCPTRGLIMGILISPMIVPLIHFAAGMFFFFSSIGLAQDLPRRDSGPYCARHTLRGDHGDGDAGRFRPFPHAGGLESRRLAQLRLLQESPCR